MSLLLGLQNGAPPPAAPPLRMLMGVGISWLLVILGSLWTK